MTFAALCAQVQANLREWAVFAHDDEFAPRVVEELHAMADEAPARLADAIRSRNTSPARETVA